MLASYEQSTDDWAHWRHRQVTYRVALQMVADGLAVALTRKYKSTIVTIYRESTPLRPAQPTPCTLTAATMHAVANSNAEHLTRAERAHLEKVTAWPFIPVNPACATIRPKVGPREMSAYAAMLMRADGPSAKSVPVPKARTQGKYYKDVPVAA